MKQQQLNNLANIYSVLMSLPMTSIKPFFFVKINRIDEHSSSKNDSYLWKRILIRTVKSISLDVRIRSKQNDH